LFLFVFRGGLVEYRCEATSIAGFVQQLAVAYVGRGYFFYVKGEIPERKDPRAVDLRIVEKYNIAVRKTARARRKAAGLANLQYIRFERTFVLIATHGRHIFFEQERGFIRDVREVPIKFAGYAISYRSGHPHVRIEQRQFLELKAWFLDASTHRSRESLEMEFRKLPFEPYAPVRSQLFSIVRRLNERRAAAQFEPVPATAIRLRRRVVQPFANNKTSSIEPLSSEEGLKVLRAVNDT
jgi:hypothetical protein